jgi:hypothetical protein
MGAHRVSWVGTPRARPPGPRTSPERPKGPKPITRASKNYDDEAACDSYMNPEPSFQSDPGDSVDAD